MNPKTPFYPHVHAPTPAKPTDKAQHVMGEKAILFLSLHVAGRGKTCLGSASAVEQPATAIPRTQHGQVKI
jgi:hypothetical protein